MTIFGRLSQATMIHGFCRQHQGKVGHDFNSVDINPTTSRWCSRPAPPQATLNSRTAAASWWRAGCATAKRWRSARPTLSRMRTDYAVRVVCEPEKDTHRYYTDSDYTTWGYLYDKKTDLSRQPRQLTGRPPPDGTRPGGPPPAGWHHHRGRTTPRRVAPPPPTDYRPRAALPLRADHRPARPGTTLGHTAPEAAPPAGGHRRSPPHHH